jgi:hypothetical protein
MTSPANMSPEAGSRVRPLVPLPYSTGVAGMLTVTVKPGRPHPRREDRRPAPRRGLGSIP